MLEDEQLEDVDDDLQGLGVVLSLLQDVIHHPLHQLRNNLPRIFGS